MSVRFIQAPPSGCRSFSRCTGHYLDTSHKPRKNRHDVSRKVFVNKANRRCSLDKQKKTPERQSRWINLDFVFLQSEGMLLFLVEHRHITKFASGVPHIDLVSLPVGNRFAYATNCKIQEHRR
jgi:hypothetical protein